MSYGIVRVQKFKAPDVKGIQIHDHRERPSRTNPDIDKERTPQNYSLVESPDWQKSIQGRLETLESTKAVRKDAVVMVQVLVTSDHDFFKNMPPEKEKAFFQESLRFIQDRYGKENVFSAVVHKDEKTPHMHVNLTPIRDRRLTAKEVFNRLDVTKLHTDFYETVGKKWGLVRGESREEKRKHLETEEFKLQTKKEQLQERMAEMVKGSAWISAEDLKPKVLEKKMLGLSKIEESQEGVAQRLNENFIKPLVNRVNETARENSQLKQQSKEVDEERQKERQMRLVVVDKFREFHKLRPEQLQQLQSQAKAINANNEREIEKLTAERLQREAAAKAAEKAEAERKRVEMDVSRLLRNTPGTVGKHMEQTKALMAEWDKAKDKKEFEKQLKQHFGKDKGIER